jgi:hypothetical protein
MEQVALEKAAPGSERSSELHAGDNAPSTDGVPEKECTLHGFESVHRTSAEARRNGGEAPGSDTEAVNKNRAVMMSKIA